ncbi:MAG: hypothetical protein FD163_2422 [Hyphomonadaceae bacterium]|nr:MAG: hypothetical protein FD163_2422 [Hyphomonadaceae bacterium]
MNFSISRRKALLGASAIGATTLLASCNLLQGDQTDALKALIDKISNDILKDSPETCTSLVIPPAQVGGPYIGRVSDRSKAAETARNTMVAGWIDELEKINPRNLKGTDVLSHSIALTSAKYSHDAAKFGFGDAGYGSPNPYVISQLTGAYVGFPDFMASQHEIKDQADADGWLSRLEGFAKQISDETSRMVEDVGKGVVPPNFIIETALKQLNTFKSTAVNESVLVTSLISKANAAHLDGAALGARATTIMNEKILPVYGNLIAELEKLKTTSTADAGVWKLPQSADYYKTALAYWTTTAKTPDEIHELGKSIGADMTKQMDEGLKALGHSEGSVGTRMAKLSEDPQYVYPNTDAGKATLLADINKLVVAMQAKLPEAFATLPKAPLEVKRVPVYTEAGAPGGYYQSPAPDGSRPGAYYINLRDTAAWPKWSLPTLTYHEGIPGHHDQISLAQEATGLPFLRSKLLWFGAYGEGWALYSETLADEMGAYANDAAGRLGYLQSMAFRAARLVVDTGLHHKRWTRQQAIDYMVEATGDTVDSITTEVERYCVWPGQACSYMIGRVEIMALREKAKTELGDKFDLKIFHDKILLEGPMPLAVLAQVIDEWIAERKAA